MRYLLDDIDISILKHLQSKGRAQRNEIAEIVGLSVPSVSERMRKLEERGLIQSYNAILSSKEFLFDITAFIFVDVDSSKNYDDFVAQAIKEPQIQECHSITGDGSHFIKARTRNTQSFEKLLSKIQSWPGVNKTRSNLVLSTFKETRELPIESVDEIRK